MPKHNRSITLGGANKIFGVIGAELSLVDDLGVYECHYKGQRTQHRTLTEACQRLVLSLAATPMPAKALDGNQQRVEAP